jgi:type IV pilus assembly protein PilC
MSEFLHQLFEPDSLRGFVELSFGFIVYLLLGILPMAGSVYLVYFLLTLPMRRAERGRTFLDLVELGLKQGRAPEAAIVAAAGSQDRSLGARFHLLAAYLEQGLRLDEALARVPRLLPPQMLAILKTGGRIGDVGRMLPACRALFRDSISQVRGALNYAVLVSFAVTPFMILVPIVLKLKVVPAFKAVFEGMFEGAQIPAFTRFVLAEDSWFVVIQTVLLLFLWVLTVAYLGGPRLHGWLERLFPGAADFLLRMLPWRRKRLQRDFSGILVALLEAAVPESEAVTLAAESTADREMTRRARTVTGLLSGGKSLPEALRTMDNSGELHWRLKNALRRKRDFLQALAGWHEALEAKAFQLEQSAAQITTTLLVLLNGVIIGSIVIAIFLALIQLLNRATLW